ncbi:MAG: nucleoside 2-deoxyribosyltransferase [Actinomycetota bacterium]|nr:nucleoside 2-deoxyribosyltransferase [Actinomycetota bacterium]
MAAKKGRTRKMSAETAAARQAKFPRHAVERALRIPQAIYDQNGGRPATLKDAVRFTGSTAVSGAFRTEVSSAKKYGYLESAGNDKVALTDRARKAIAPQLPTDRLDALREAVLAAPDLSDVYNFYRGENLPDQQFLVNALTDRFALPADKVGEFLEIFDESLRSAELIDASGSRPRLVDVGRDEQHRSLPRGGGNTNGAASPSVPTGSSCFVMQPFNGPLGGYYESIYKPAIEQAGMQPLRADAEIFGTGKIMDQIWRGIRSAKVLVAELTTKNPNVFYELGLAHALEKPVVLVSSNEDDVPFDLRHIRVILYDQGDPFWGQKLSTSWPTTYVPRSASPRTQSFVSKIPKQPPRTGPPSAVRSARPKFRSTAFVTVLSLTPSACPIALSLIPSSRSC